MIESQTLHGSCAPHITTPLQKVIWCSLRLHRQFLPCTYRADRDMENNVTTCMLLMLTNLVAGQDEMIELGEREATEAVAEKEAAETAAHAALMKEANLEVPYLPVCLI